MQTLLVHAFLLVFQGIPPVPSGVVTGVLRTQEGTPAARIRVAAMPAAQEANAPAPLVSQTQTDAAGRYRLEQIPAGVLAGAVTTDGVFQLTMPDGEYRFSLCGHTTAYAIKSITYGSADITTASLTIDHMVPSDDLLVTIRRTIPLVSAGVKVGGHFKGGGTEGLHIALASKSGGAQSYDEAVVNSDGSFAFTNVEPGTYTLVCYGAKQPYTDIQVGDKGVDVELTR